jgi:hypothetical protein
MPDVVYVGRGGANSRLSVVDLYGFGAGTGNPTYDDLLPIKEGNSNFPNNRNVKLQGALLIPPLERGRARSTAAPGRVHPDQGQRAQRHGGALAVIESVVDMAVGHALDTTFNNASPFAVSPAAATCARPNALKARAADTRAVRTRSRRRPRPTQPTKVVVASENLMLFAPAPNPPPLTFPPLCLSPLINALEPTSADSLMLPPRGNALTNLMVPGQNFLGNPSLNRPPTTLLPVNQHSYFDGPSPPQPLVALCYNQVATPPADRPVPVRGGTASRARSWSSTPTASRSSTASACRTRRRWRCRRTSTSWRSPTRRRSGVVHRHRPELFLLPPDRAHGDGGRGPDRHRVESGNEGHLRVQPRRGHGHDPLGLHAAPAQGDPQPDLGTDRGRHHAAPARVRLPARRLLRVHPQPRTGRSPSSSRVPDGLNGWGYDDTVGSLPFTFFKPKTMQPDVTRLGSGVWC